MFFRKWFLPTTQFSFLTKWLGLILTGESTEVSKRFIKYRNVVEFFNWDEDYLIECTRDIFHDDIREDDDNHSISSTEIMRKESTSISRDEYTTFSASKKILLGGFRFFDFLFAIITFTKQSGTENFSVKKFNRWCTPTRRQLNRLKPNDRNQLL